MFIYVTGDDGNLEQVGTVGACFIRRLTGPSYVHVYDTKRERFGLPNEPYDWYFETYKEALDWANEKLGGILIGY